MSTKNALCNSTKKQKQKTFLFLKKNMNCSTEHLEVWRCHPPLAEQEGAQGIATAVVSTVALAFFSCTSIWIRWLPTRFATTIAVRAATPRWQRLLQLAYLPMVWTLHVCILWPERLSPEGRLPWLSLETGWAWSALLVLCDALLLSGLIWQRYHLSAPYACYALHLSFIMCTYLSDRLMTAQLAIDMLLPLTMIYLLATLMLAVPPPLVAPLNFYKMTEAEKRAANPESIISILTEDDAANKKVGKD
jgi:hypothetical protein